MASAAMEHLPPGVYFKPSPEECVNDYLLPWSRGELLPEMGRYIHEESVYRQGPDELRRTHAPATTRAFEPKWYFLSRWKKRGGRTVATGGNWGVEQKHRILEAAGDGGEGDDDIPGGTRKCFRFFLWDNKDKTKTPWLMEEFTAAAAAGGDGGGRDDDVPVLCRIYVSPRATNDEKRAIFGEAGVAVDDNMNKKPERVVVPAGHFDALAKRVTAVGNGQAAPPPDVLGHRRALPPPPILLAPQINHPTATPPAVLGPHQRGHPLPPSPRPDAHRSGPSGAGAGSTTQREEEAIRPAKRARRTAHHAPQSQDTGMDALQNEIIQETEPSPPPPPPPPPPSPPLRQEMLPFDVCRAANEPFSVGFSDLLETSLLPPFADDERLDFGKICEFGLQFPVDDGDPLPPDPP